MKSKNVLHKKGVRGVRGGTFPRGFPMVGKKSEPGLDYELWTHPHWKMKGGRPGELCEERVGKRERRK